MAGGAMTLNLFGGHDRHMFLPGKSVPDVMRMIEPVAQCVLDGNVRVRLEPGMFDLGNLFFPLSIPFGVRTVFQVSCLLPQMVAFSEDGIVCPSECQSGASALSCKFRILRSC